MKKVTPAVALSALALLTTFMPAWRSASAQQVASMRTHASGRAPAGGGGARLLKRMTLSVAESAEGSRVRITSDAALEGYQTFAEGGRFFVLVPEADATVLSSGGTAARGFTHVEAGQRGDDALIAFTLVPGFVPRVRASFNRLEILFAAQSGQQPASGGGSGDATPTPTPTPTPATPETTNNNGGAPAGTPPATGAAAGTKVARLAALRTPEKLNPTTLNRFGAPPVIDGKLDDEVWKTAAVFKDFIQFRPVDLVPPSQPTEVRIGYDSRFLYIGFRAFDEPGKVRATVAKRDAVFDDDWVGIWLDTFNDGRRAYELIFNPLGVQADAIFTEGINEDFSRGHRDGVEGRPLAGRLHGRGRHPVQVSALRGGQGQEVGAATDAHHQAAQQRAVHLDARLARQLQPARAVGMDDRARRHLDRAHHRDHPQLDHLGGGAARADHHVGAARLRAGAGQPLCPDTGRFLNEPIGLDPGVSVKSASRRR